MHDATTGFVDIKALPPFKAKESNGIPYLNIAIAAIAVFLILYFFKDKIKKFWNNPSRQNVNSASSTIEKPRDSFDALRQIVRLRKGNIKEVSNNCLRTCLDKFSSPTNIDVKASGLSELLLAIEGEFELNSTSDSSKILDEIKAFRTSLEKIQRIAYGPDDTEWSLEAENSLYELIDIGRSLSHNLRKKLGYARHSSVIADG